MNNFELFKANSFPALFLAIVSDSCTFTLLGQVHGG